MNLNQLKILVSAADRLNLSGAATELGMSQPAVSLQMKHLEQEFGMKLYRANNRGIRMTPKGEAFAEAVRPLVAELERIERQFKSANSSTDHLIIGGTHTLTETVLLQHLVWFRRRHPDVHVAIEAAGSPVIEQAVDSAKIDVGLISGPSYLPGCAYEPFGDQEIVAFVPRGHALEGRSMGLDALMREPLVTKKDGTCIKRLIQWGFKPNLALECIAADAVQAAVMKGLGAGLLFRARIEPGIRRGDFRLVDVPGLKKLSRQSFIVYRRHEPLSDAARDFIAGLRNGIRAPMAGREAMPGRQPARVSSGS